MSLGLRITVHLPDGTDVQALSLNWINRRTNVALSKLFVDLGITLIEKIDLEFHSPTAPRLNDDDCDLREQINGLASASHALLKVAESHERRITGMEGQS